MLFLCDARFPSCRSGMQLSAVQCDGSCTFLCGLNASSFTFMDRGVVSTPHYMPRRPYLPTTITARNLEIRSHPNETWWLDPRQQATYCQWGWPIDEDVQLVIVSDQFAGSPRKSKYWAEMPGKCKSWSRDGHQRLVDRLTEILIGHIHGFCEDPRI